MASNSAAARNVPREELVKKISYSHAANNMAGMLMQSAMSRRPTSTRGVLRERRGREAPDGHGVGKGHDPRAGLGRDEHVRGVEDRPDDEAQHGVGDELVQEHAHEVCARERAPHAARTPLATALGGGGEWAVVGAVVGAVVEGDSDEKVGGGM
ncbi:hypothetical protein HWV62_26911 [Athelia sp. TMB]|nr:hypothetical protein HWV62_26911 [Athelia sp. TMB]